VVCKFRWNCILKKIIAPFWLVAVVYPVLQINTSCSKDRLYTLDVLQPASRRCMVTDMRHVNETLILVFFSNVRKTPCSLIHPPNRFVLEKTYLVQCKVARF
jgi:hypothetical protein